MSEDFLKNPVSLFDIKGKTAIVTGASGAFGALSAKVLAGAGANVVLAAGGADALKKVAGECEALGAKVETVAKRPSSEANCDAIVAAAVQKFGRVDILVNNAGYLGRYQPFEQFDPAECPNVGGSRLAGVPGIGMERLVCSQGDTEDDPRQAHRRAR